MFSQIPLEITLTMQTSIICELPEVFPGQRWFSRQTGTTSIIVPDCDYERFLSSIVGNAIDNMHRWYIRRLSYGTELTYCRGIITIDTTSIIVPIVDHQNASLPPQHSDVREDAASFRAAISVPRKSSSTSGYLTFYLVRTNGAIDIFFFFSSFPLPKGRLAMRDGNFPEEMISRMSEAPLPIRRKYYVSRFAAPGDTRRRRICRRGMYLAGET